MIEFITYHCGQCGGSWSQEHEFPEPLICPDCTEDILDDRTPSPPVIDADVAGDFQCCWSCGEMYIPGDNTPRGFCSSQCAFAEDDLQYEYAINNLGSGGTR